MRQRNLSNVTQTANGRVDHCEIRKQQLGLCFRSSLCSLLVGQEKKNPVKGSSREASKCHQWEPRWKCIKVISACKQQCLVIKIYYFIVLINSNDRVHSLNAFHHHLIHLIPLRDKYYYYLQFSRWENWSIEQLGNLWQSEDLDTDASDSRAVHFHLPSCAHCLVHGLGWAHFSSKNPKVSLSQLSAASCFKDGHLMMFEASKERSRSTWGRGQRGEKDGDPLPTHRKNHRLRSQEETLMKCFSETPADAVNQGSPPSRI